MNILCLLLSVPVLFVSSYKMSSHRAHMSILNYHKWHVIGQAKDVTSCKPTKIVVNNKPITLWKDTNNRFMAINDVCPHRGASLAEGRIDRHLNCVVCPYHTFKFNKHGRLVQTPGQNTIRPNMMFNQKTDVTHYNVVNFNGWLYLHSEPKYDIDSTNSDESTIWIEPEAYDDSYKCVTLKKLFNVDARTVTENSLDILHISEVHTFGNKKRPLPINDEIEKIAEGHYKARYEYESGEDSLAYKVFGIKSLVVENEYVLPHYTVARVKFGEFVNTIVTSALPISDNQTMLHVKAYRNNWVSGVPAIDYLFDKLTERMMEKTLNEDRAVIEKIYYDFREGNFITKYDELTRLYREDYNSFIKNNDRSL